MPKQPFNRRLSPEAAKAISAGSSFSGCCIAGFFMGKIIAIWYPNNTAILIVCTVLGFLAGNWAVYKILMDSKS